MSCFVHPDKEPIGHCVECGKSVCLICMNKEGGRIFCDMCARLRAERSVVARPHPHRQSVLSPSGDLGHIISNKSPGVAAVLAFVAGSFGVHKFYLGEVGWGILYLMFFWTGIPTVAAWIEGILFLTKSEEEFAYKYGARALNPRPHQVSRSILPAQQNHPKTPQEYERFLLKFAKEHQGVVTVSQVVAESHLSIEKVEEHLATLAGKNYARSEMDPETGRISYIFPEFRNKYLN